MNTTVVTTIGSIVVAVTAGLFAFLNSRSANKNRQVELQQAFTTQVMADVERIREDASAAREGAKQAQADNDALTISHRKLRSEMGAMQDWVERVVRARDAYVAEHPLDGIEDSGVIRLMRAINGGPRLTEP